MQRGTQKPYVGHMRWAALFQDFESQLDAAQRADFSARSSELARAEASGIELVDRFRAAQGRQIRLQLRNGNAVTGVIDEVAATWLLLSTPRGGVLIPVSAVDVVHQLTTNRAVGQRSAVLARLGLGHTLRALARDRALVRVAILSGDLNGVVAQVGRDHLELALTDEPRVGNLRTGSVFIPFAALQSVSELL